MEKMDVYQELSKKLSMENSRFVPKIWQRLCTEEEAEIINALPGTPEEMASRFGMDIGKMASILERLFQRGVVFEQVKDGKTIYRMPRHIIQFHDATILWPDITEDVLDLWAKWQGEEYPRIPEMVTQLGMPSLIRVVPVNEPIEFKSEVLPYEDAVRMVEGSKSLAVTKCTCRMIMKKCDKPLEVCLQLNKGADYTIKRGTGRKVSVDEAKEILKKAEAAGLVHTTENRAGIGNVLCSCCECCCIGIPFVRNPATRGALAPSRYQAVVDDAACTGCGLCVDICPVDALSMNDEAVSVVDADICIGCGLCAGECPSSAIMLKQVRPQDFIPA
jgi:formate hydrogenlyase subunit 6/NADH:ubiquinone oxidoreductase subunit I